MTKDELLALIREDAAVRAALQAAWEEIREAELARIARAESDERIPYEQVQRELRVAEPTPPAPVFQGPAWLAPKAAEGGPGTRKRFEAPG